VSAPRPALQHYTLRNLEAPLAETLERVREAGFEGVQFARPNPKSAAERARAAADAGLDLAGAHVGVDAVRDAAGTYADAGFRDLVIPSWEREGFADGAAARAVGADLDDLATRLPGNCRLHYHNHAFEFTPLEGESTAFDAMAGASGIGLELDTGLARHAGADPVALVERYGDRVDLLHLTDTRPGSEDTLHVEYGEGVVDLAGCLAAAERAGVEWVVAEHGQTDDPLATLSRAGEFLAAQL
jgi:sugar phosphate isomerase/epimerase